MSVLDINKIDGIAISKDGFNSILLITDHLDWDNEYDHLIQLQEKINSYISFIESEQYKEVYPQKDFLEFIIEIHFMYDLTDNCSKFIDTVNKQLLSNKISLVPIGTKE